MQLSIFYVKLAQAVDRKDGVLACALLDEAGCDLAEHALLGSGGERWWAVEDCMFALGRERNFPRLAWMAHMVIERHPDSADRLIERLLKFGHLSACRVLLEAGATTNRVSDASRKTLREAGLDVLDAKHIVTHRYHAA